MRRQIPSPQAVSLETGYRTAPKLWSGKLSPPWNILMENARTFLTTTGCSLTSPGHQSMSLTMGLWSKVWELKATGSFTHLCSTSCGFSRKLGPLPGHFSGFLCPEQLLPPGRDLAHSALLSLHFSVLPVPFPTSLGIYSPPPVLPVKCSQRDITDPISPRGPCLMMNKALTPRSSRTLTKTLGTKL